MSDDTKSIEDVLHSLIQEYGKSLYKKESANRLKSFLSDFAVSYPKERKVLNVLIDEGIPEKLLDIDSGSNDEKHHVAVSCCLYLIEDIGFTEKRAIEAVKIFTTGLGWKIPIEEIQIYDSINDETKKQNEQYEQKLKNLQKKNQTLKKKIKEKNEALDNVKYEIGKIRENYKEKEIIELEISIDDVLSKKLPTENEVISIIYKINELKKRTDIPLSFYGKNFQEKITEIKAIEKVFDTFDLSFLKFYYGFIVLAGIVTVIICFIKERLGLLNFSFFMCVLGCIMWGLVEGFIHYFLERILIKTNIQKVKKDVTSFKKFCPKNIILFLIKFILLFVVGGFIGGVFAEIAFNGTFGYGCLISSCIIVLDYCWKNLS